MRSLLFFSPLDVGLYNREKKKMQ